ncbi:MAG: hypothetical protein DSY59_00550 [Persephonella sp.]|nr:MAG: hypothetical protein DSY60_04325 [Persephonella sp.]RUM62252.1 MAG: hypothetical protein DSY59_00550 [Persephonella sp.]
MEEQNFDERNPFELKAYPFAIVGFFITDKAPQDSFREELSVEEMEEIQSLIKKYIFKEGTDIVIAPFIVPPDQVDETLRQLAEQVFRGENEE